MVYNSYGWIYIKSKDGMGKKQDVQNEICPAGRNEL